MCCLTGTRPAQSAMPRRCTRASPWRSPRRRRRHGGRPPLRRFFRTCGTARSVRGGSWQTPARRHTRPWSIVSCSRWVAPMPHSHSRPVCSRRSRHWPWAAGSGTIFHRCPRWRLGPVGGQTPRRSTKQSTSTTRRAPAWHSRAAAAAPKWRFYPVRIPTSSTLSRPSTAAGAGAPSIFRSRSATRFLPRCSATSPGRWFITPRPAKRRSTSRRIPANRRPLAVSPGFRTALMGCHRARGRPQRRTGVAVH